jgi:DNA-binding transcriptional LysR family regulator
MIILSKNTNIGLRHLRCALAIDAQGSFSAAADALGVVPSALTETIRQLEEEAGARLFDRQRRPVRPTAAGRQFLQEAEQILRLFDHAMRQLSLTADLARGHVSIAAVPSLLGVVLAPALERFRQLYPAITVTVHDGIGARVEELLHNHQAELGLSAQWGTGNNLHYHRLASDPFGVACHKSHVLARQSRPLTLSDLERDDCIGLSQGNAITRLLAHAPDLPARVRDCPIMTHSTIGQLQLIQQGAGFALLPRMAAQIFNLGDVVFIDVEDLDLWRDVFLVELAGSSLSPAAQRLKALMMETVGSGGGPTDQIPASPGPISGRT